MRRGLIGVLSVAAFAGSPSSASALTIGSLDPTNTDPGSSDYCVASNENLLQGTVAPGYAFYTVPQGGGTITSWSTRWGTAGSTVNFEVWRSDPTTTRRYTLIAKDSRLLAPGPTGISTYGVNIPVQAGDVIGLGWPAAYTVDCSFHTVSEPDANSVWGASGSPTVGTELDFGGFEVSRSRLNAEATLQQSADLAITQVPSRRTLAAGNAVNFILTASNAGPSPVTATVKDTLSGGLSFFSAVAGGGSCSGTQTVTCQVPLDAKGSQTISIVAVGSAPGAQTSTATISSSAIDGTPGDNTASAIVTVVSVPKLGKISKKARGHRETFKFTLDQAASVRIVIRRSGKRVASISGNGRAGSNSFKSRRLPGGHYKAVVTATTAAGSASKTVSFSI